MNILSISIGYQPEYQAFRTVGEGGLGGGGASEEKLQDTMSFLIWIQARRPLHFV